MFFSSKKKKKRRLGKILSSEGLRFCFENSVMKKRRRKARKTMYSFGYWLVFSELIIRIKGKQEGKGYYIVWNFSFQNLMMKTKGKKRVRNNIYLVGLRFSFIFVSVVIVSEWRHKQRNNIIRLKMLVKAILNQTHCLRAPFFRRSLARSTFLTM